ncbi:MAG: tetratricopeptide repeat protein [bacterium]|nr:tetratricopeptide repeat protein [bacterium]
MFEKTLIHPGLRLLAAIAAAWALFLPPPASAQGVSTSELLEEAIFLEEVTGDLDAAIEIYQRIAADAEAQRPLAARALYRLYRCYERQGEEVQASLVFSRLRRQYPDYEELLAGEAGDLPRSLVLEPAPWLDDEIQVLVMRLPTGREIGTLITSVHPAVVEGEKLWRVGLRRFYGANDQGSSVVEARRGSFTPIRSRIRHSALGKIDVEYLPGEVVFYTFGQDGRSRERSLKADHQLRYDKELWFHLLRRLPLEVGYKTALPLINTFGEMGDLVVEVTSREQVEVLAGAFDCFRLDIPLYGFTVFVSSGPRRGLVKIEAQGFTLELAETIHRGAQEPVIYRDPDLGLSVSAPAGWHIYRFGCFGSNRPVSVQLLDPEAELLCCVERFSLPDGEHTPALLAEGPIRYNKSRFPDLRVREKSWRPRKVGGRPATSWISDYAADGAPGVYHETVVLGKTHGWLLTFITTLERFEQLRGTFDKIADGLVVP